MSFAPPTQNRSTLILISGGRERHMRKDDAPASSVATAVVAMGCRIGVREAATSPSVSPEKTANSDIRERYCSQDSAPSPLTCFTM